MNSIQPNPQVPEISVLTPIDAAFSRVKRVLFQPFDLGKWFVIGFAAWLAHLGEQGLGFNYGSNYNGGNVRHEVDQAKDFVMSNLTWIIPVVAVVVLLVVGLWILFIWLNSRGKFMFLHCVALNKSEIRVPWHKFAAAANSLFWFRLGLVAAAIVVILPLAALMVVPIIAMANQGAANVLGVVLACVALLTLIVASIAFALVGKLTTDFVVPIMFLRGKKCLDGWRELRGLLTARTGSFALYILMYIVLSMAIGIMILILILVTCCIAGCFLVIPYIGTVLLLPTFVFTRAYSAHFLSQFGPEYDVFSSEATPQAA